MGLFNNIVERKTDGSSTIVNYDIILSEYARKKDLANYLHKGRNKTNILHSNIDMGNNKITNLGNPGSANDAVSKREGSPYIACNERQAFFTSEDTKRYKLWSCQNVCEALIYLLDNIYIRFGTKLYRQIVGIPMGTNCAPLVADLFLFCYERDFMTSLSDVKQAENIEAFKSTSRYLDDLLNIDNPYFEGMVNRIYPPELQLNKANTSDTEAPFLDLHLSISNGFFHLKFMISAMTLILI